jgi:hypothetical protein
VLVCSAGGTTRRAEEKILISTQADVDSLGSAVISDCSPSTESFFERIWNAMSDRVSAPTEMLRMAKAVHTLLIDNDPTVLRSLHLR